jgi:hypothetical protein
MHDRMVFQGHVVHGLVQQPRGLHRSVYKLSREYTQIQFRAE